MTESAGAREPDAYVVEEVCEDGSIRRDQYATLQELMSFWGWALQNQHSPYAKKVRAILPVYIGPVPVVVGGERSLVEALVACEEVLRLIHEAAGPVPKSAPMPEHSTFGAWKLASDALASRIAEPREMSGDLTLSSAAPEHDAGGI